MRRARGRRVSGPEFGGSGEDSFVAVVVTKLTGALLLILLLTMVIMALLPKAIDRLFRADLEIRRGRRGLVAAGVELSDQPVAAVDAFMAAHIIRFRYGIRRTGESGGTGELVSVEGGDRGVEVEHVERRAVVAVAKEGRAVVPRRERQAECGVLGAGRRISEGALRRGAGEIS